MVEVDMSDIDSAIKTLKSEADAAHNAMIQAVERLNLKTPEVDEAFAHRDFLKSEGDRFHTEFVDFKEKADDVHAKIDEMMVDVNKARDELKSVREERKSWLVNHNAAVNAEMKTGAQSEEVANSLAQSLLSRQHHIWRFESRRFSSIKEVKQVGKEKRTCEESILILPRRDRDCAMLGIIMAGGKGTRLFPLTENKPKPLVEILGIPVIDYVKDALIKASVEEVVVTTGFNGES